MASREFLTQAYLAYFGRPVDFGGLQYWATKSEDEIIAGFSASNESKALYGADFGVQQINAIYNTLFGRDAEPAGLTYWLNKVYSGELAPLAVALGIMEGAADADKVAIENKLAASEMFTDSLDTTAEILAYNGAAASQAARSFLFGVTATPATQAAVDAALQAIVSGGTGSVNTISLTVGQDILSGTGGVDVFKANVAQNQNGYQVNTLGSGDELNGGASYDTLNAKITSGAFAGGSWSMPIQPETNSVELIKLQAVLADVPGDRDTNQVNDHVYVNAKDMVGVKKIASNYSDADLTIMNLTSKGNSHVSEMTVGMEYTGNADHKWDESDFSVYFDQDYLTTQRLLSRPSVDIRVMNEDGYDETAGLRPLEGVVFRELTFTLNGVRYDLQQYMGEDLQGAGDEIRTYDELLAAVKEALVELKAAHPNDAALQTVEADLGPIFHADRNPDTLVLREGVSIRLSVEGITNGTDNDLEIKATDLEVIRAPESAVENNNRYERADNEPPSPDSILSIKVDLEKVGLAGDGGELVIGSMNKGADANEWNAVNTTTDTVSGIQEFQVTVHGTNDKSSSLSGLRSTNNQLQNVIVTSAGGSDTKGWADLTIGNSNTDDGDSNTDDDLGTLAGNAAALKDVRVFDASALKGDLELHAALTQEVTAKYLNLVDAAPNLPAEDNVAFEYTGGVGNDLIDLVMSSNNFHVQGSGVTREDWSLTVDGGDGDDELVLSIDANGDTATGNSTEDRAAWYSNQKLMQAEKTWAQIAVIGGEGNDTVRTEGSGDYAINLGAGADTAYLDNTGGRAQWVLNAVSATNGNNIVSSANTSYDLFKTKLEVDFDGFEVVVDLKDVNGKATDLDINQAMKLAINSDPVLSKLLVATDGPGNTLVVTSLVDGAHDVHAFTARLIAPTTLSAGEVNTLNAAYGTALDAAGLIARFNSEIARFSTIDSYSKIRLAAGTDSVHVQDSRVEGGLGNDVLVLGTGLFSNDTIVYNGFGNGYDSIVHFDVGTPDVVPVPSVGSKESFKVTFADLTLTNPAIPTEITVDSHMVTLVFGTGSLIPAEDVAYEFANQWAAGAGAADWTVAYLPGTSEVVFTAVNNGNQTDVTAVGFNANVTNGTTAATISEYVQGVDGYVAPEYETFTVDFNGSVVVADGTFTFDGVSVNYVVGDGPLELATKVMAAFAGNTDWTVTNDLLGVLTFTATADGDFAPDATDADFGEVVPAPAVPAEVSMTFVDGTVDGDITVAGLTVAVLDADTANEVAVKVANAWNTSVAAPYTAWTAVADLATGEVVFTQDAGADFDAAAHTALFTFVDTDGTGVTVSANTLDVVGETGVLANGIAADVTIEQQGVAESGDITFVETNGEGIDYIDFSSYGAKHVSVDGVLTAGTTALTGEKYITLVESTTNDGEYVVKLWQEAGATDTELGVIGTLDFGVEQDFIADNFIL